MVLCFLKQNPLGSAVNNIRNKHIKIHPLKIRTIPTLQPNNNCNILFLTQQQMTKIATQLNNKTQFESIKQYSLLFTKDILIIGDLSEAIESIEKVEGGNGFSYPKKNAFWN